MMMIEGRGEEQAKETEQKCGIISRGMSDRSLTVHFVLVP